MHKSVAGVIAVAVAAIASNSSAEPINLSKEQMLADFDQAISFIDDFSVHKDLNRIRLGIDYEAEFAKLRMKIHEGMDKCEFYGAVNGALNLVQDLHVSTMGYDYLSAYGKYQKRFNFAEDETFESASRFKECEQTRPSLKLPIIFQDGKYIFYTAFTYNGMEIEAGTEVQTYNGQPISEYIQENYQLIRAVKLGNGEETPYTTRFAEYGDDEFVLGLSDGRELSMNKNDSVEFSAPVTHEIGFMTQTEPKVLYFERERILYIAIPMMNYEYAEVINGKIDDIYRQKKKVRKVAIDIRGNPGGNDMTWRAVLSHLASKDEELRLNLKAKYNDRVLQKYAEGRDIEPVNVPLLDDRQYWTLNDNVLDLPADEDSVRFAGKIYLLQDEYIYSSAGNFSNYALTHDNIISIGDTTDYVGGGQIEPLFFKLDHSGMFFRIEPVLDFSGVKTLEDFSHNRVEVRIPSTYKDYYLRSTYVGDLYGVEFLRTKDKLFRYVVKQ